MRFKNHFFFFFLLISNLLSANSTPPVTSPLGSVYQEDGLCDLLPPTNFHVVDIGPTWIKYAWDTPVTPRPHRIRTYRASDGSLLVTTNVPAGVDEATVVGLPSGTEVYSTINAVCSDGSHGIDSPSMTSTTLILDLVTNGYTSSSSAPTCSITQGGLSCTFYLTGAVNTFQIRPDGDSGKGRQFGVHQSNGRLRVSVASTGNSGQTFLLALDNNTNLPRYNGNEFEVLVGEAIIAKFDLSSNGIIGQLNVKPANEGGLNENYEIVRLTPGPGFARPRGSAGERSAVDAMEASALATAYPNPFSESLDVFLAQPSSEQIHLQLFNLAGQKVLDQQFPGGQEQYSLSTASLSPGFYMLRIEVDGEVQTLKVVKSE